MLVVIEKFYRNHEPLTVVDEGKASLRNVQYHSPGYTALYHRGQKSSFPGIQRRFYAPFLSSKYYSVNRQLIQVAARSKASVCSRLLDGIVGSNPAWRMDVVCYGCCVLSGRVLCSWLITHPEESYRLWCDREALKMRRPWPTGRGGGLLRHGAGEIICCFDPRNFQAAV